MNSRPLLYSEYAIIREAYKTNNRMPPSDIVVLEDDYDPSWVGAKKLFNADFMLKLCETDYSDVTVEVVPVRPHTMGAEYFIVIRDDGLPVLVHLLAGEAIPLASFSGAVKQIDASIAHLFGESCTNADYLRIAELSDGISFLVVKSPDSELEELLAWRLAEMARLPVQILESERRRLFVRRSANESVLIDGFLQY